MNAHNRLLLSSALAVAGAMHLGAWHNAAVGQIDITGPTDYVVGPQPSDIVFADVNGNGFTDLVTLVDNPDRLVTLLNDGAGTLTPGPVSFLPPSLSPSHITGGDFTGNGIMDIAVSAKDTSSVLIMTGLGTGSFGLGSTTPAGDEPRRMATADVNGDGALDLAVANRESDNVTVMINTGSGTFTTVTIATGEEPRDVAFADFNGDGFMDLAVSCHDTRDVRVYNGNGAGAFTLSATLFVGGQVRPDGIDVADISGNGFVDIVAAVSGQNDTINNAAVFVNSGGGAFAGPFNTPTAGIETGDVIAVDLDCDGAMDLVTANKTSNNISILRNTGGGLFAPAMLMPAGISPDDLSAGDLSGNGSPDLAVSNSDGTTISVYMNDSCEVDPGIPGDLDGDGVVDGTDLALLLGAWGQCADCQDCPADLDGNCMVDGADLAVLLGNWG